MIYFDHNATTPVDMRVLEAMLPFQQSFYGNPSSLYRLGRVVRSAIDTAREQVAALVDASPEHIIFTSGGTEANNLALNSVNTERCIAISSIEHPSINDFASKNNGIPMTVDNNGLVSLSALNSVFQHKPSPTLVSIMMANNETGVIQNIESFSQFLQNKQVLFHTDAIQALGKIPISFKQSGVNLMSLSSHKIYGPKGCGALVVDKTVEIEPLLVGGGQENGWRAGTENVAAIIGFGRACELARLELDSRSDYLLNLRNQLEQGLKSIPALVIFAEKTERLPNTVQFGLPNMDGEMLLMQLDQKSIAVSSGSACASGGGEASTVLTAMGVGKKFARSAIRISLGKDNTEAEVKEFIKVLKNLV